MTLLAVNLEAQLATHRKGKRAQGGQSQNAFSVLQACDKRFEGSVN
jgi:hypothetical protein